MTAWLGSFHSSVVFTRHCIFWIVIFYKAFQKSHKEKFQFLGRLPKAPRAFLTEKDKKLWEKGMNLLERWQNIEEQKQ